MHRLLVLVVSLTFPAAAIAHPGSGIAVDKSGNVYFTDTGNGVWKVEPNGRLSLISSSAMHWMTIDPEGRFSQSPTEFGEWFGRLTPKGTRPALISCSDFPCIVGKDGHLYFAYMHGPHIKRLSVDGSLSDFITRKQFGIEPDRPVSVSGVASGPDGSLYVVSLDEESWEPVVWVIDDRRHVRAFAKNFVKQAAVSSPPHHESRPEYCRGLAVDGAGNMFVAVTGSRCVLKLTPLGEASVVLKSEKPWSPTGVDVHSGDVYVLEYDDETPTEGRNWPPRVRRVSPTGEIKVIATIRREP